MISVSGSNSSRACRRCACRRAGCAPVSREHRRAKTDRLDTELLKRSFLGWLRGERDHCKMVDIPTIKDEDAKRPDRERDSLIGE
jgi:transposase